MKPFEALGEIDSDLKWVLQGAQMEFPVHNLVAVVVGDSGLIVRGVTPRWVEEAGCHLT
jgi:hypothetical protein